MPAFGYHPAPARRPYAVARGVSLAHSSMRHFNEVAHPGLFVLASTHSRLTLRRACNAVQDEVTGLPGCNRWPGANPANDGFVLAACPSENHGLSPFILSDAYAHQRLSEYTKCPTTPTT
jgi:hypothetical protein